MNAVDEDNDTALHLAASWGKIGVVKVLVQNGANPNALHENYLLGPLHCASQRGYVACTLQLLCCGAEIDALALDEDHSRLLLPIHLRLEMLRNGKRMKTTLMSKEERRFMWNLCLVFTKKYFSIAFKLFKLYYAVRSFYLMNCLRESTLC